MPDHPLSPGDSSGVERGPWHYGADYVSVHFQGDPKRLQHLLPSPFTVSGGQGVAYVCEIVSVNDADPEMVAREPDRTTYQEAAVGLKCRLGDKTGVFYPVMWVSTEWALLRGLINGYQKRLADKISMTRIHPLNPKLMPIGEGSEMGGFCVKGSKTTLRVEVRLERRGEPADLPSFGVTFGRRFFPRTDASQGFISEAVEILKSNSRTTDVWLGKGTFESSLDLGRPKVLLGTSYRAGFTISGSRVLSRDRNL
jgi:acetoacetate decarboxylase